jgi:GST-like protein
MAEDFRLLGCRGCGSVIVEAAFRVAGIPYDYEEVDYDEPGPQRDRLFSLNPLGQVPTLVMPDGGIMTESAAIVMLIDDKVPEAGLVPPAGVAERAPFLRWLFFLVGAVYPTFTYGDDPKKWLPGAADPLVLKTETNRHREALWRQVERSIEPRPWFLGVRFSALDLYVATMVHWRPRQDWFRRECPKLFAIAGSVEALPPLAPLFRDRFD